MFKRVFLAKVYITLGVLLAFVLSGFSFGSLTYAREEFRDGRGRVIKPGSSSFSKPRFNPIPPDPEDATPAQSSAPAPTLTRTSSLTAASGTQDPTNTSTSTLGNGTAPDQSYPKGGDDERALYKYDKARGMTQAYATYEEWKAARAVFIDLEYAIQRLLAGEDIYISSKDIITVLPILDPITQLRFDILLNEIAIQQRAQCPIPRPTEVPKTDPKTQAKFDEALRKVKAEYDHVTPSWEARAFLTEGNKVRQQAIEALQGGRVTVAQLDIILTDFRRARDIHQAYSILPGSDGWDQAWATVYDKWIQLVMELTIS